MNPNEKLSKEMGPKPQSDMKEVKNILHQNLIGVLIYSDVSTRHDKAHAVSVLS